MAAALAVQNGKRLIIFWSSVPWISFNRKGFRLRSNPLGFAPPAEARLNQMANARMGWLVRMPAYVRLSTNQGPSYPFATRGIAGKKNLVAGNTHI